MKNPWTASPIRSPESNAFQIYQDRWVFIRGLLTTNSCAGCHGQDHLLTSLSCLLIYLHHGHNMLTDNSQSLLYGGSRISLRALSLFVSGCLYVINSAPAHWQTSPSIT